MSSICLSSFHKFLLEHIQVRRVDVDNYTLRRTLVTCQVRVYWVQEGNKPPRRLSHNVKLLGAKEFAFLTVTSPRLCIGVWYTITL